MNIFQYIRSQRQTYEQDTIPVVEGYDYSQYKKLRKEELYWAGLHETKIFDAVFNGAPPFDNSKIKKSVIEEYVKTDFDTKDVEIRPTKPTKESRVKSMITTRAVRKWMDDNHFNLFLNELCWTRAKNGGVLVKNTKDGVKVVPWLNVITDQTDILSGVVIERHYYTPAELLKKEKDGWGNLQEAVDLANNQKTVAVGAEDKETQGNYIEVYEVHGQLPESFLKEDGDDNKYIQAMFILAGVEDFEVNKDGDVTEQGIVLFQDKEKELPYKLLNRNPIHGRGLGTSVIEDLFESTKWKNFTYAEEMRILADIAKTLYITDDPDLPDNLQEGYIEHGTVLKKNTQTEFRELVRSGQGLPQLGNVRAEWTSAERDAVGMYEANTGEQSKSNTPFRAQALQSMEGNARFEQYREEIGIFLEEILKDWVLPDAIKDITKEDELFTEFEGQDLKMIDDTIIAMQTNDFLVEQTLDGVVITPEILQLKQADIAEQLISKGTKRHITEIKEFVRDYEGEVKVVTTNEGLNKQGFFETRVNLLQFFPEGDPRREAILDRITDESGVTPDELQLKKEQMGAEAAKVEFKEEQSNAEKALN